jgi:methylamine---glutamate N-methyltransferase subunit C
MNNKPVVADNKPIKVELTKGEDYYFCSCGKSENQPYCDGSHKGSLFAPKKFTAANTGDAYLCMCKQSKNTPYCDGSHKSITKQEISKPGKNVSSVVTSTPEEPHVAYIHELAKNGLSKMGPHGQMGAMGVPGKDLPRWDDIQFLTGQMAKKPLLDDVVVDTELTIGKKAKKPLTLKIPIFVSDMSFGALSEESKIALAKGAETAGTGICSGEGGGASRRAGQ